MTPSDRIRYIKEIANSLGKESWRMIDLTLNQFGISTADAWNGTGTENYIIDMISISNDSSLTELAKHLGIISEIESLENPTFWSSNDTRIFISHLVEIKIQTSALAKAMENFGFNTFVAHVDIEPTKEWQDEIELALSTMDAMIALISPNFILSKWCDQEVGIAIGRKVPIIPIKLDQDPYGFVGKYQALQGKGKTADIIANEVFEIFIKNPVIGSKLTNSLIIKLQKSDSWAESKHIIDLVEKSQFITQHCIDEMKKALDQNSQVSKAFGVPDRIKRIESRFAG